MRMILDGRGQYFPGDNSFPTLARQMDHDLRSPLTTICSYAECIAWLPNLEPAARESYAYTIVVEARRLGRMAANFLVLAAPPLSNDLEDLDLGCAVDAAIEELRDMMELHQYQITWERPAALGLIWPSSVLHQLLMAALEAGLEGCKGSKSLCVAVEQTGEEELVVELVCPGGDQSRMGETFAFRATEALVQQRGGKVTLQTGRPTRLTLALPRLGRVRAGEEQEYLEKSA